MLEYSDIQGLVLSGHSHLPHARFLFLQIQDRSLCQVWLGTILPEVGTAARRPKGSEKPGSAMHVAFTAPGLVGLGLSAGTMESFPREFVQGMGHGERTKVLGDSGNSAPELWQVGGSKNPEVHILLMLYASSEENLAAISARVWDHAASSGLKEVFRQESFRQSENEPFGFRDGISQPAIEGAQGGVLPGQTVLKAGEFLIGYVNEYGEPPPMPTVGAAQDAANLLPSHELQPGQKAFGRNGSYLVWRKMAQDVTGFWSYMDQQTKNKDGTSNREKQVWLAAKFVGRWPSGAPLTLSPDKDDAELGADKKRNNQFDFTTNDAAGFACPIGAHIRRGNPRDMLSPNPQKSTQVSNRHRLVRRGRPYLEIQGDQAAEHGLLFIAVNANLQTQFEFVQQTWLNSPKFGGLCDSQDPLVSDNDGTGIMVIQSQPVRQRLHGLPRFVQVKGGGYFFLPGIKAIQFLAQRKE